MSIQTNGVYDLGYFKSESNEENDAIIDRIRENIKSLRAKRRPNDEYFIYFLIDKGFAIFEDCVVPDQLLFKMLRNGQLKYDCLHPLRGDRALRYKAVGVVYPKELIK